MGKIAKDKFDAYNTVMIGMGSKSANETDAKSSARSGSSGNNTFVVGDTIEFASLEDGKLDIRENTIQGQARKFFTVTVIKRSNKATTGAGILIPCWEGYLQRSADEYVMKDGYPMPTGKEFRSDDPVNSSANNMFDYWNDHKGYILECTRVDRFQTREFNSDKLRQMRVYHWKVSVKPSDVPADVTSDAPEAN